MAAVIAQMREAGYLKGIQRGRNASAQLCNEIAVLEKWRDEYSFDKNGMCSYYSADEDILNKLAFELRNSTYALSLHSGANQITRHVTTSQIHLYLPYDSYCQEVKRLRKKLKLLELKEGGTIHFLRPYYKYSIFYGRQKIEGMWIASFVQLYLDLYHYPARGREHADILLEHVISTGRPIG